MLHHENQLVVALYVVETIIIILLAFGVLAGMVSSEGFVLLALIALGIWICAFALTTIAVTVIQIRDRLNGHDREADEQ